MAKAQVKMAVDPFRILHAALAKVRIPPKLGSMISIDYDEEADVLYTRFSHAKITDNSALDDDGMVLASLGKDGRILGLIVMNASRLQRRRTN